MLPCAETETFSWLWKTNCEGEMPWENAEGNALGLKFKCCFSVRVEDGTTRSR